MRKYFCDICGKPISTEQAERQYEPPIAAQQACGRQAIDICASCADAGKKIDVPSIILQYWKQGLTGVVQSRPARKKKEERIISADLGSKSGPGNHWRKKKYISKQLLKYRKINGLGCLQPLAEKSGVPQDTLRQMLESQPVEIEIWRMVGAALDDFGIILTEEEAATC